ncbi:MAG: hypothetical protein IPO79_16365 [Flavobacteriales bacterium]|nr:hypothetical protein [Flavobacteriales bacterium]
MVFKGALDAEVFRISSPDQRGKAQGVPHLDNLPVHHAKVLRPWLEPQGAHRTVFMPGTELNPWPMPTEEERDQRSAAAHRGATRCWPISGQAQAIKSYFGHPDVRYAA